MQTVHKVYDNNKKGLRLLISSPLTSIDLAEELFCLVEPNLLLQLAKGEKNAKNQDCVVEPVHFLIDCISPQQFVTDTLLSAGIDLKQGKGGREYTFTPVSAERNDNLEDNDEVSTIKA